MQISMSGNIPQFDKDDQYSEDHQAQKQINQGDIRGGVSIFHYIIEEEEKSPAYPGNDHWQSEIVIKVCIEKTPDPIKQGEQLNADQFNTKKQKHKGKGFYPSPKTDMEFIKLPFLSLVKQATAVLI